MGIVLIRSDSKVTTYSNKCQSRAHCLFNMCKVLASMLECNEKEVVISKGKWCIAVKKGLSHVDRLQGSQTTQETGSHEAMCSRWRIGG